MTAWFYLSPDSDTGPPLHPSSEFGEHLTTSANDGGNTTNNWEIGKWFQVSTPITSVGNQLIQLAVVGMFGGDWAGTVYVDDISIQ